LPFAFNCKVDPKSLISSTRLWEPQTGAEAPIALPNNVVDLILCLTGEETMTTDTACAKPSPEENWLPILERATQEVFEIMLGCQVKPAEPSEHKPIGGFTAIVGLAGALCGVVTVCCAAKTAGQIAKGMLGDTGDSEGQVVEALGEMCNMIAGNFKNKLAGTDERCMLSVPTVISGGQYSLHSMANGHSVETVLLFEDAPITVRLQLQS